MKKMIFQTILLISCMPYLFSQIDCPSSVMDIEGNSYPTVKIGSQCWMAQNMRAGRDCNGKEIPLGNTLSYTAPLLYLNVTGESKCGYLYNWTAAMRVCPKGWHLPTDAEWGKLLDYVGAQPQFCCGGQSEKIAKALADTTGWAISRWPDSCAVGRNLVKNNTTGFSVLPAGPYDGNYSDYGGWAYFWSATSSKSNYAYYRYMANDWDVVNRHDYYKSYGFSVRCVRNQ